MATGFGSSTTAEQVVSAPTCRDIKGLTIIVTGANSGLGVETTRVLCMKGANVTMACRNLAEAEKKRKEILELLEGKPHGDLTVRHLDLSDLASVRTFAAEWPEDSTIDVLINNAGIMAVPFSLTPQGFEAQIGTNHVGHFELTRLLLPKILRSSEPRVVTLSSSAHERGKGESILASLTDDRDWKKRGYSKFSSYGDSKLANMLFARELAKREPKVLSLSVHPGVIPTPLFDKSWVTRTFAFLGRLFMKTVPQGAATTVFAATTTTIDLSNNGRFLQDCHLSEPKIPDGSNDELAAKIWKATEDALA